MSCKELIDSLKKAADERIKKIWSEAEAEAGELMAGSRRRLDQLREDLERKQSLMNRERANQAVSEANRRARAVKLASEKDILDRLHAIASSCLPALRGKSYPEHFVKMVRELPRLAWQTVRVNPADVALAKKQFPDAEAVPDPAIGGGM